MRGKLTPPPEHNTLKAPQFGATRRTFHCIGVCEFKVGLGWIYGRLALHVVIEHGSLEGRLIPDLY
jgi:hypothetical protein